MFFPAQMSRGLDNGDFECRANDPLEQMAASDRAVAQAENSVKMAIAMCWPVPAR